MLGFLDLPFEIRRMVYSFLIPQKCLIRGSAFNFPLDYDDYGFFNPHRSRFNVLRLSRQISGEALDILYEEPVPSLFEWRW